MILEEWEPCTIFLFVLILVFFMEDFYFWKKGRPWFHAPLCNLIKNLRPRNVKEGMGR